MLKFSLLVRLCLISLLCFIYFVRNYSQQRSLKRVEKFITNIIQKITQKCFLCVRFKEELSKTTLYASRNGINCFKIEIYIFLFIQLKKRCKMRCYKMTSLLSKMTLKSLKTVPRVSWQQSRKRFNLFPFAFCILERNSGDFIKVS